MNGRRALRVTALPLPLALSGVASTARGEVLSPGEDWRLRAGDLAGATAP